MTSRKLARIAFTAMVCFGLSACIANGGTSGGEDLAARNKTLPEAPLHLALTGTPSGFMVTWGLSPQDPGSVIGYEIVRAAVISGPYQLVGTVGMGVDRFLDTRVPVETIVYYKVRALAKEGASPYSQTVAGELPGNPGK